MGSAFSFDEGGEDVLFAVGVFAVVGGACCCRCHDDAPSRFEDFLSCCLELDVVDAAEDGGGGVFAVGVEGGDEAPCDEVVDVLLGVVESLWRYAGGYDGVVVGDLRGVEEFLVFAQCLSSSERSDEVGVGCLSVAYGLIESVHDVGTLRVDIVGQVLRVDTWVGGVFAFVEGLDEVECHLGGVSELLVALYLQGGEVEEVGWQLLAVFLGHAVDGEGFSLDGLEGFLSLLYGGVAVAWYAAVGCWLLVVGCWLLAVGFLLFVGFVDDGGEGGVAVDGGEYPVGFWLEVVDLVLSVDDESERGCLYASDGEDLSVLSVFEGVEACGVHAEEPVADGP